MIFNFKPKFNRDIFSQWKSIGTHIDKTLLYTRYWNTSQIVYSMIDRLNIYFAWQLDRLDVLPPLDKNYLIPVPALTG